MAMSNLHLSRYFLPARTKCCKPPELNRTRKPANKICLDCHGPLSPNGPRTATFEGYTHHRDGSPGGQCVACHMPQIETTLADVKVHAHTFKFITPDTLDKYKIPNPCNPCHTDKSRAWATEALRHWPERSP